MNQLIQRRRLLQSHQLNLLLTLYTFRFSTRPLLAQYLHKDNNTSLYSRLSILEKHRYIAKRYNSSYKLSGRPAEYYVLPKGLRALRDTNKLEAVSDTVLQTIYKDRSVLDPFIQRTLKVFAFRNILCDTYDGMQFFTQRDMQPLDYFPRPLPDAFLSLKSDRPTQRYFLEYVTKDSLGFMINRRLKQLITYYEEDTWGITDTPFPTIICVCETPATEKRVSQVIRRTCYQADIDDIPFYTTTEAALTQMKLDSHKTDIWTHPDYPNERHDLCEIAS